MVLKLLKIGYMKLSKLIKEIKRVTREEDPDIAIIDDFYEYKFHIKYS